MANFNTLEKSKYLSRFGISLEDYESNFGGLIGKFKPPNNLIILNPELKNDYATCFYILAYNIFNTANNILGQKPSIINPLNFEEFIKYVGERRANNFKLAIYEELKYRCISNYLPELANKTTFINQGININENPRAIISSYDLLTNSALEYLEISNWEKLDISEIDPFEEYKFSILEKIKPFYLEQKEKNKKELIEWIKVNKSLFKGDKGSTGENGVDGINITPELAKKTLKELINEDSELLTVTENRYDDAELKNEINVLRENLEETKKYIWLPEFRFVNVEPPVDLRYDPLPPNYWGSGNISSYKQYNDENKKSTIPWPNLEQIKLEFNENVCEQIFDLNLRFRTTDYDGVDFRLTRNKSDISDFSPISTRTKYYGEQIEKGVATQNHINEYRYNFGNDNWRWDRKIALLNYYWPDYTLRSSPRSHFLTNIYIAPDLDNIKIYHKSNIISPNPKKYNEALGFEYRWTVKIIRFRKVLISENEEN